MRASKSSTFRSALAFASALALTLASASGCGGASGGPTSRVTGGPCKSNMECQQTCLMSDTFPKGYCTLSCASDGDCPSGAACVKDDFGNICEVLCTTVNSDCTAFGPKFACDEKARVVGAAARVCRSH